MSNRIALLQCINPSHRDSTPSMAVHDHSLNPGKAVDGKDKLQVFCFGCKFYAWVTREELNLNPTNRLFKRKFINEVIGADNTDLITKFFIDRNFDRKDIPWGELSMGIESQVDLYLRPFMEWDLYNYRFNPMGKQRRYLDKSKPKTRYLPGPNGNYASIAWINLGEPGPRSLYICESWIDAQWVNVYIADQSDSVMSLLGTNSKKILPKLYTCSKKYGAIYLWFDGDGPGLECESILYKQLCEYENCSVFKRSVMDHKVYEL